MQVVTAVFEYEKFTEEEKPALFYSDREIRRMVRTCVWVGVGVCM